MEGVEEKKTRREENEGRLGGKGNDRGEMMKEKEEI